MCHSNEFEFCFLQFLQFFYSFLFVGDQFNKTSNDFKPLPGQGFHPSS